MARASVKQEMDIDRQRHGRVARLERLAELVCVCVLNFTMNVCACVFPVYVYVCGQSNDWWV